VTDVPYGMTTYCDDIREEMGGKLTFVGCYSGDMIIFGIAPTALPIFCAYISFRIPPTMNFNKAKIVLSIDYDLETKELARAEFDRPENGAEVLENLVVPGQILSINLPIKLAPLTIEKDGFIRSRAYLDEVEYKLGSLKVVIADPASINPTLNNLTPATS
jgi:hypothetical protein